MDQENVKNNRSVNEPTVVEKFDEKMKKMALQHEEEIAMITASNLGYPYTYLVGLPISPNILSLITKDQAIKFNAIAFGFKIGEIKLAVVDPMAEGFKDFVVALSEKEKAKVLIHVCSPESFRIAYKLYAQLPEIKEISKGVEISQADLAKYDDNIIDINKINDQLKGLSVSEIFNLTIAAALKLASSDIHIEAEEELVKIRFRIDGRLHDAASLPHDEWQKIISRLKLVSGLKLNINDRPQDGRFTIHLTDDKVDVRVSTLPTSYGESVVMRLLRSSSVGLNFDDLGLSSYAYKILKREIEKPNGMVITTGPTGSGKTTTLYAILNYLNSSELKIITLEDPVEYKLVGINQSQIDMSKGYTFAAGLRSILRQDPDIVMVGEIRDLETADIAINASLTGHLVLSTIHTNSAAGAIPRFLAMGVKPFLLAPSINSIIGQRLVRKLCPNCKKEAVIETEQMELIKQHLAKLPKEEVKVDLDNLKFYEAVGCDKCYGLGYKGRVGIYEILVINPEIEKNVVSPEVSEYAIQELAMQSGMVSMVQDGILKALDGITSINEVFEVAK